MALKRKYRETASVNFVDLMLSYKRPGVTAAILVLLLFLLWFARRDDYHAVALVDIGGYMNIRQDLQANLESIEIPGVIEQYVRDYVLPGSKEQSAKCVVQAPKSARPQLMVQCSGASAEEAKRLVEASIAPLINRHTELFDLFKAQLAEKKAFRQRELDRLDERVEAAKRVTATNEFYSWYMQERAFELEERRAKIISEQEIDDARGRLSRPTKLNRDGVKIINRAMSTTGWLAMGAIAALFGIATILLLALGNAVRAQVPDTE